MVFYATKPPYTCAHLTNNKIPLRNNNNVTTGRSDVLEGCTRRAALCGTNHRACRKRAHAACVVDSSVQSDRSSCTRVLRNVIVTTVRPYDRSRVVCIYYARTGTPRVTYFRCSAVLPATPSAPMYHHRNNAVARTSVVDPTIASASIAVHDGFATVRRPHHYVGHKRRRAAGTAIGLQHLEPVTEHVAGGGGEQQHDREQLLYASLRPKSSYAAPAALPPLPSDVPWWEIATRRRPKSCADFASAVSDTNDKVPRECRKIKSIRVE